MIFHGAFKFSKKRNSEISKELTTAIITSYLEGKKYIYIELSIMTVSHIISIDDFDFK